jgi:predicted nucleic acid-binding protein
MSDILSTMKIYLDNCSLQRPLDSKVHTRIVLEAEAVLGILALFESGQVALVSSEALLFEIDHNPNTTRQEYALEVLSKAKTFVTLSERVEKQAGKFETLGIKPLDALHLASAEDAQADYFCTCDDRLFKRAKAISGLRTKVVSPVELIKELERW